MMAEVLRADAVFEGGGVKGIGLVGALQAAEERGYRWERVAGTSAGAIVAAMVAAGFTAAEIKAKMDSLDYRRFQDTSLLDRMPGIGPLISLGIEKGIYEGRFLEELLRGYLAEKGVCTFGDLRAAEGQEARHRYRLQVVASDLCRGRMLVLPQDAATYGLDPDALSVARAVRMSMSIPFFFEPVRLQDAETGEDTYIVDGGVLSNYPIWLFDARGRAPRWPTFGFRLAEGDDDPKVLRHEISGPLSLLAALFFTAMEAHDARHIAQEHWVRTIPIPATGVKATDFDLGRETSDRLFESGRRAAKEFFEGTPTRPPWDFDAYVAEYRRAQSQ